MSILPYVMALLLLIGALTYARMHTIRTTSTTETAFIHYMTHTENETSRDAAKEIYDLAAVKKNAKTESAAREGTSRLNLFPLFDKNANEEVRTQTYLLAKELFEWVGTRTAIYAKLIETNPRIVDDLLERLQEIVILNNRKTIKKDEWASLDLKEKTVNDLFYYLLKGVPKPFVEPKQQQEITTTTSAQAEAEAKKESQEAHAEVGYVSLLNYITAEGKYKTRVYLASGDLLQLIYKDKNIVDDILIERKELYRQLMRTPKHQRKEIQGELTERFLQAFQDKGSSHQYHDILNFTVTGTDPDKYK